MKPRVVACSAYSPKLTLLPTCARPRLRPFCCFRNFVRFGCSISVLPTRALSGRLRFLALFGVQIEHVAGVDPHLDPDNAVCGARDCGAVIDTGAQRMQRYATFPVPFGPGDVGAVQAASDLDLDALGAQPYRVADGTLHRAAEHDTAFELLRNAVGDQLGIELRLADLADAYRGRHAEQIGKLAAQALDIFTLLADDDPRARRVNRDLRLLGRTLDMNPTDGGLRKFLLDESPGSEVAVQVVCEVLSLGIPACTPILGDAEPDSGWMYLVTHNFSLLLRYRDRDVAGSLQDPGIPALGACTTTLERWPFIHHDHADLELVDIGALVVLGVRHGTEQYLAHDMCTLLGTEIQQLVSPLNRKPPDLISQQPRLLCRNTGTSEFCSRFH